MKQKENTTREDEIKFTSPYDGLVFEKVQEAKEYFSEGLQPSGYNNFRNFKYLETSDILPEVHKICKKLGLITWFSWTREEAILHIKCKEDSSILTQSVPLAPITTNDPGNHMQDVGRVRTYATRYAYIGAFEIPRKDEIDDKPGKKQKQNNKKSFKKQSLKKQAAKKEPNPKQPLNKPTQPTNTISPIQARVNKIKQEMQQQGHENIKSADIKKYIQNKENKTEEEKELMEVL